MKRGREMAFVGRCATNRFAKIAPKSAIPIEPPTWRKSIESAVATPMCFGSTEFWTARTSTCMTIPIPNPTTSM